MPRFEAILALGAALAVAPMAQAGGLVAWSDEALGITAEVPQGWGSDTLPGGGVLFTAPGGEPRHAPHVALRAYPDPGADLGPAHDQSLRALLLDGAQVTSDQSDAQGFEIRATDPSGKVELIRTLRLACPSGPVLATVRIDYPADRAEEMAPLLADVPESLACE